MSDETYYWCLDRKIYFLYYITAHINVAVLAGNINPGLGWAKFQAAISFLEKGYNVLWNKELVNPKFTAQLRLCKVGNKNVLKI